MHSFSSVQRDNRFYSTRLIKRSLSKRAKAVVSVAAGPSNDKNDVNPKESPIKEISDTIEDAAKDTINNALPDVSPKPPNVSPPKNNDPLPDPSDNNPDKNKELPTDKILPEIPVINDPNKDKEPPPPEKPNKDNPPNNNPNEESPPGKPNTDNPPNNNEPPPNKPSEDNPPNNNESPPNKPSEDKEPPPDKQNNNPDTESPPAKTPDINNSNTEPPLATISDDNSNTITPDTISASTSQDQDRLNPKEDPLSLKSNNGQNDNENEEGENSSNAFDPTKPINPLSGTSSSTVSPTIDTGEPTGNPENPLDPNSPYRAPAIAGIVIAILLATFVLVVILRKVFSNTPKKSRYQRTYSMDGQQGSMTGHGLPQNSIDNDTEEIKVPPPVIARKSSFPPNSQLVEIDLNENITIIQTDENDNRRSIDYNELKYYVKGFDDTTENPFNDEMAETESIISSTCSLPRQPNRIVTWEECMR